MPHLRIYTKYRSLTHEKIYMKLCVNDLPFSMRQTIERGIRDEVKDAHEA